MSAAVAAVIVERLDELLALERWLNLVERERRRNGLPASPLLVRLKTQVATVITMHRTLDGHENRTSAYRYISTAEYATRRGCSQRTARRHAQHHGRKTNGHWQIPIPREE